jgi:hypothetical protein
LNIGGRARRYGVPLMGQVEARRRLVVGVAAFVVVGVALHVPIGLPTWIAIVIAGLALGLLEGVEQRGLR